MNKSLGILFTAALLTACTDDVDTPAPQADAPAANPDFERFWQGRPDTHGTGLGLPIAKQVAEAHGGDLTVRSPGPAGDGCAFELRLRR